MKDRVYLVDGMELDLLEDCKGVTYFLIDLFDNGEMASLISLVDNYGKSSHIETLEKLRVVVSERFCLRSGSE